MPKRRVVASGQTNKTIKSDDLLSDYLVEIIAKQIVESYKLMSKRRLSSFGEEFSTRVGSRGLP